MSSKHLTCPRCRSVDTFYTVTKGPHQTARCSICHTYIKHLPSQEVTGESIMHFGKYKDLKLKNIPPDYLLWMLENNKLKGSLKEYVEEIKSNLNQKSFEAR